jgi:hypothetical protein
VKWKNVFTRWDLNVGVVRIKKGILSSSSSSCFVTTVVPVVWIFVSAMNRPQSL